jgi:DinB family.
MGEWTLSKGGSALFSMPRLALVRTILLNHSYHHRGQLTVYLRLLDVPVPGLYGPSADDDPFK